MRTLPITFLTSAVDDIPKMTPVEWQDFLKGKRYVRRGRPATADAVEGVGRSATANAVERVVANGRCVQKLVGPVPEPVGFP